MSANTKPDFVYHDERMWELINQHPNFAIPWYLAASYAYYQLDVTFITDGAYDELCRYLLRNMSTLTHIHRDLITEGDLIAGSCYSLSAEQYPARVKSMAAHLLRDTDPVNRSLPLIFLCACCLKLDYVTDADTWLAAVKDGSQELQCHECRTTGFTAGTYRPRHLNNLILCVISDRELSPEEYKKRFAPYDVYVLIRPLPSTLPYVPGCVPEEELAFIQFAVGSHTRKTAIRFL